jgi:peptidoglycan/LPS O-acetylase OafA/YrhL
VKSRLADYAYSRDNNFNLLRFIAASMVLLSHSFPLSLGPGAPEPLVSSFGITLGGLAVDIFFITSGFLVTGSLFSRSLTAYLWARFVRIYPALVVSVLFCVFIVGIAFTTREIVVYLADPVTLKFLAKNSTLFFGVKYKLPGVFEGLPYERAVNGSLWTLPGEVKCYVYLAAAGYGIAALGRHFGKITPKAGFLGLASLSVGLDIANYFVRFSTSTFLHLFAMFFVGAAFFIWRDKIVVSRSLFASAMFLLLATTLHQPAFQVAYRLLLAYAVLWLALVPGGWIRNFNKAGDYSYGVYIYAFPVQQSLMALTGGLSPTALFFASFFATLFLAVVSWHTVEKRCLRFKGKYAGGLRVSLPVPESPSVR